MAMNAVRLAKFGYVLMTAGLMLSLAAAGLAPTPVQAAGASLKISPASGVYEVGSLIDISFVIDTGGEAVNAIKADVRFPADKLQVVNPAASTSFITIWVTAPQYSNTDGTLKFEGGLPNPGIKTDAGVISTVTFRVKSAGQATISYAPTSQVLRNDGQGTNILTSTSSAELAFKEPPPAGPIVTSPSHPDSNQWYNNGTIQFSWEPVDKATAYSYSLDQNVKSVPDETPETDKTNANLAVDSDGIWYFHIRAKTDIWGGTTTFAVRIDTTAPANFQPQLDKKIYTPTDIIILRFLTTDGASGLDHYEWKQIVKKSEIGQDTLYIEATSPYTVQPLPVGDYQFVVRAYDRAGNSTEGTVEASVSEGGLTFLGSIPLLRDPAVANGVLIILGLVSLALLTWFVLRHFRVRSNFRRDLEILERDARRKAEDLNRELEEIRQAEETIHHLNQMDQPAEQTAPPIAPVAGGGLTVP